MGQSSLVLRVSYARGKVMNVGIIGYGHWGKNFARVFSELPQAALVAICETSEERRQAVRHYYPHARTTASIEELLSWPEVEAVVVATPAATHYSLTKRILLAGRHVLVEKPLALEAEHAEEVAALAAARGLVLMVGHTFLYNPAVRLIKELMSAPDFGQVYYLQAVRTHLGLVREDVNVVWDLAPHDVSIFTYLLDMLPVRVSATGVSFLQKGREDAAFVTLHYPNGIVGNIHVSWLDASKVRTVTVVGSQSRVVFDDLNSMEKVKVYEKGLRIQQNGENFGEFQLLVRDGDIRSPRLDPSEPLKNECREFIACVENGSRPLADGANGVAVVRVLTAIDHSLRNGGALVELRTPATVA